MIALNAKSRSISPICTLHRKYSLSLLLSQLYSLSWHLPPSPPFLRNLQPIVKKGLWVILLWILLAEEAIEALNDFLVLLQNQLELKQAVGCRNESGLVVVDVERIQHWLHTPSLQSFLVVRTALIRALGSHELRHCLEESVLPPWDPQKSVQGQN